MATKVNINGINELDFPSSVSASVSHGVVTLSGFAPWASLAGDLTETQVIPWDGPVVGTPDTGISRISPDTLAIGNGISGDISGTLDLSTLNAAGITGLIDSFATPPLASFPNANNFTGALGFQFRVSQSITVSQLGRLYRSGNTQNHSINLWISTNTVTPLVSATILAASPSDSNGFKWASISPTTLTPSNLYAIALDETNAGDTWLSTFAAVFQPQILDFRSAFVATPGAYPNLTSLGSPYIVDTPAMMYTTATFYTASLSSNGVTFFGDTGISRVAGTPGTLAIGNGTSGDTSGSLSLVNLFLTGGFATNLITVGTAAGIGAVTLRAGDASDSGFVEWINSSGTRIGYLGFSNSHIVLTEELAGSQFVITQDGGTGKSFDGRRGSKLFSP